MKPRVVKAWACGFCHKLFSREHGKALAAACCMCGTCGVELARRTSTNENCRTCGKAAALARAEEDVTYARDRLDALRRMA